MRDSWKPDVIKIGNKFQLMIRRKATIAITGNESWIVRHINKRQFLFIVA
uniref:Uncharacterized protein n=1 Tax=Candidatus Kentrum sp. LPFa TaxID=2126335 RepID=A0A450W1H9_9GAMM|nr:MAG: hypothetical protein BECKLPF1236B_GA0070989_101719 [Candidatus Kentron sp. LPFa]